MVVPVDDELVADELVVVPVEALEVDPEVVASELPDEVAPPAPPVELALAVALEVDAMCVLLDVIPVLDVVPVLVIAPVVPLLALIDEEAAPPEASGTGSVTPKINSQPAASAISGATTYTPRGICFIIASANSTHLRPRFATHGNGMGT